MKSYFYCVPVTCRLGWKRGEGPIKIGAGHDGPTPSRRLPTVVAIVAVVLTILVAIMVAAPVLAVITRTGVIGPIVSRRCPVAVAPDPARPVTIPGSADP